jgi:hypothetical protein
MATGSDLPTVVVLQETILGLALSVHSEFCAEGWETCPSCADVRFLLAAIPVDAVVVTPESLAQALAVTEHQDCWSGATTRWDEVADAVLAAITAESGTE